MIVVIQQSEIILARTLGEMRHKVARDKGYYRQMGATPDDDILTDRNGIIGEIAFGRWANCFVDLSFEARRGGCDFRFRSWRIDVKTTRVEGNGLTIDGWKMERHAYSDVDIFVLAELMTDQRAMTEGGKIVAAPPGGMLVNLVGYISVKEFQQIAKPITFANDRKAFIAEREFLSPMSFLEITA